MSHFEKNYLVRLSESRKSALMEFLKRVELKGVEAPVLVDLMNNIQNSIPDDGSVYELKYKKEEVK